MSKEDYILPEGSERDLGRNAQKNNILAAKLVGEVVRTTLGPKGMDKMIVDSMGEVIITNDGATILNEMNIEHPAGKMIVEIAKMQEEEVGDGTTTAVVLAAELLKRAEFLLDQNVHPTIIAKGYRIAAEKANIILTNLAEKISEKNTRALEDIAKTAMTGKGAESAKELLAKIVVNAVIKIIEKQDNKINIDLDNIKIERKAGENIKKSELIEGIILDKEKPHAEMPSKIINAKIALINDAIELKNTEIDSKISISDPSQIQAYFDMEENIIKNISNKIISSGANVVICQKGIDDLAQHYFAKQGVLALRRVKKSDMNRLMKATGGKIISKIEEIEPSDLGFAGLVEQKKVGEEFMTFISEVKNPKSITILLRASTEHVVEEIKRAVEDSLGDISSVLKNNRIIGGAGSCEVELARQLRKFSNTLSGREQLAVLAFADSMEIVPKTLAENSGLDPIDVMTMLKAKHNSGEKFAGINVFTGKTINSMKEGIIEPLSVKTNAVSSASEVAIMILRIDDVIVNSKAQNTNDLGQE